MKTNDRHFFKDLLKGLIAAMLIAACFFALNQRLPQRGDMKGMVALAAICMIGSVSGLLSDIVQEDFLAAEESEESPYII